MDYRKEANRKTLILRIFTSKGSQQTLDNYTESWQDFESLERQGLTSLKQLLSYFRKYGPDRRVRLDFQNGRVLEMGLELLELDGELPEKLYNQLEEFHHRHVHGSGGRKDYWVGIVEE